MQIQIKRWIWRVGFLLMLLPVWSYAELPALMSVDELRPGMKGVGKTVFSGTTIEEFDVEILAVLKNDSQIGDVIMAKVSGSSLGLENVGIVAGMSGSPIYIDGKLIGALAFAQSFSKAPMIAGITPIHEMLADARRNSPVKQAWTGYSQGTTTGQAAASFQMLPIQTPLLLSGIDPRALPLMREQLAAFAMTPVQSGNMVTGTSPTTGPELEPGSAVGVQVIRGDMNATAVGTITYRDQQSVLAFGHPMFSAGEVNLPMTSAYVHFVWSTQLIPFKVASPLQSLGAITRDYRTGIAGTIGAVPAMIPLKVTVHDAANQAANRQYTFEVIDHPLFAPVFVTLAGMNAMLANESAYGETTVRTQTTITLRGYPPLIMEDVSTGVQDLLAPVIKAFTPLQIVLKNSFTPVAIEHIALDISVEHTVQDAEIVGLRIGRNEVHPGETVDATILLQPYGEAQTTMDTQLVIPEDLQQERVILLACDTKTTTALEAARASGKFQPQDLNQLITLFNDQVSADHLVLSLLQLRPGVVVQGRELPSPPLSMMSVMGTTTRSSGATSLTRGRMLVSKNLPTQYVVSGCAMLELTVDHSSERADGAYEAVAPSQGEK